MSCAKKSASGLTFDIHHPGAHRRRHARRQRAAYPTHGDVGVLPPHGRFHRNRNRTPGVPNAARDETHETKQEQNVPSSFVDGYVDRLIVFRPFHVGTLNTAVYRRFGATYEGRSHLFHTSEYVAFNSATIDFLSSVKFFFFRNGFRISARFVDGIVGGQLIRELGSFVHSRRVRLTTCCVK